MHVHSSRRPSRDKPSLGFESESIHSNQLPHARRALRMLAICAVSKTSSSALADLTAAETAARRCKDNPPEPQTVSLKGSVRVNEGISRGRATVAIARKACSTRISRSGSSPYWQRCSKGPAKRAAEPLQLENNHCVSPRSLPVSSRASSPDANAESILAHTFCTEAVFS